METSFGDRPDQFPRAQGVDNGLPEQRATLRLFRRSKRRHRSANGDILTLPFRHPDAHTVKPNEEDCGDHLEDS